MSIAFANINTGKKLEELILSFNIEYAILQSIPKIFIGKIEEIKKELGGVINPCIFDSGRLFSQDIEIRWRKKNDNEFYTLIISDIEQILDGYEKKDLETFMDSEQSYYLWGEKTKDIWSESRIPKVWKYPVTNRFAKIKVIEYEISGRPEEGRFYRFCGFEGATK